MSSPVSSCRLVSGSDEALKRSVSVGVVGGVVLPAVPDDVEPGAGEDSYGVGMVVAAGDGTVVEVGRPGVGASRVAGEVGDGVTQLFVAGPAESDGAYLAGLSGRGCDAGEAGQRFWCGEAGAAVADLGEQSCGADAPGAGQAGEDVRVGVQGQLFVDLDRKALICSVRSEQNSQKGTGDVTFGGALFTYETARRSGQAGMEDGRISSAAVADAGQPGGQGFGESQSAPSWHSKRPRKVRLIWLSMSAREQPHCAGEDTANRCSRSWLANPTRWATRSLPPRQAWRSVTVAGLSGVNGCSGARSVRRVSASTKASKRSSLLPAEP